MEMVQLTGDGPSGPSGAGGAKLRKASRVTRNPHGGVAVNDKLHLQCRNAKELIFEQWKNSEGAPISDYAKCGTFEVATVHALGSVFPLSDIRTWGPRQFQPGFNDEKIRLEFFLDGYFDYSDDDACAQFTIGLIKCLENALAVGATEKEREFATSSRKDFLGPNHGEPPDAVAHDAVPSASAKRMSTPSSSEHAAVVGTAATRAGESPDLLFDHEDASTVASISDVNSLNIDVEHYREAGCMVQFVVARCSIGIDAAKLIGEQVFPDYFQTKCAKFKDEIDPGKMPWWMLALYGVTILFGILMAAAWRQAFL
eukprot:g16377.t1